MGQGQPQVLGREQVPVAWCPHIYFLPLPCSALGCRVYPHGLCFPGETRHRFTAGSAKGSPGGAWGAAGKGALQRACSSVSFSLSLSQGVPPAGLGSPPCHHLLPWSFQAHASISS